MARTILGLDMVDTFTSSETCPERGEAQVTQQCWGHESRAAGLAQMRICPMGTEHPVTKKDVTATGLTMVKGMNWRMLPRLPCSRQSTHSSMNHWTNWVWVPAVLAPRMEEMSRKRFAVETGKYQKPGHSRKAGGGPSLPDRGQVPTSVPAWLDLTPQPGLTARYPRWEPAPAIT